MTRTSGVPILALVSAAVLAHLAVGPSAHAQVATGQSGSAQSGASARLTDRPASSEGAPLRDAALVVTRAPAIRMVAEPGGVVVVRVPVPTMLFGPKAQLFYSVRVRNNSRLLAPVSGTVPRGRDAVPFTFSLGRRLSAGVNEVALVEFRADSVLVEVPVELEVPRVSRITLQTPGGDLVASTGRWSVLRVRILNGGNSSEPVVVRPMVNPGWRDRPSPSVTVAAGGVSEATAQLWVPPGAASGLHVLRVVALQGDRVIAETQARVQVRGSSNQSTDGLTVALSTISANSGTGTSATGYGLNINGRLSDSTTLDVRGSLGQSDDPLAVFTLARSGLFTTPPAVQLTSPRYSIQAGVLSASLRDPGGAFLAGLGGSSSITVRGWRLSGFGGRPFGGASQTLSVGRGLLAGAGLERLMAGGSVGVQTAHLDDRQLRQGLQTITVHGSNLQIGGGILDVSLAGRRLGQDTAATFDANVARATGLPLTFDKRPRLGGAATYRMTGQHTTAELRLLHAPGGAQSFARSGSEVAGSASRRLGRWFSASGGGWYQGDNNQLIGRLQSTGWFAAPAVASRGGTFRLALDARGAAFSLAQRGLLYENQEALYGGSADLRVRWLVLRGRSLLGSNTRRMALDSSGAIPLTGSRQEHTGTIGISSRRGTLDATYMMTGVTSGAALQPPQRSLVLRLDQLRLLTLAGEWITLSADAQQLTVSQAIRPQWSTTASLSVPLWGGLSITGAVDRNPFLSFGGDRTGVPLMYSIRVDQKRTLRRMRGTGIRQRRLFVDENRNGTRDRGESALAGVTIECGTTLVSTDLEGRFECASDHVQLDMRTLPLGIIPPSETPNGSGDMAAVRVQPVAIVFSLPPLDSVRLSASELAKANVYAKDESGMRWFARSAPGAQFVFDALPVGRYVLDVEQGGMTEPLTVVGGDAQLWVTRDEQRAPHVLAVRGRQTRIRIIGAPSPATADIKPGAEKAPAPGASARPTPPPAPRTPR